MNIVEAVKKSGKEPKKGFDKKQMKSKWAAKACVVLLLIKNLLITIQAIYNLLSC